MNKVHCVSHNPFAVILSKGLVHYVTICHRLPKFFSTGIAIVDLHEICNSSTGPRTPFYAESHTL